MRRSLYHLTFLVSVGALALTTMPASGFHAWSGYHWQRSSNPVTIELGDNVDSGWDGWLVAASADWSASTVLDVPVAAGQAKGNCKPPSGRVEVCNKSYGFNGGHWHNASGRIYTDTARATGEQSLLKLRPKSPDWFDDVQCTA